MSEASDSIQMEINDPEKRVAGLKFVDAPQPPDTQSIIQPTTPEPAKSYPFKVENIPLPSLKILPRWNAPISLRPIFQLCK